jgi:prevent-host-death family protein
METIGVFAAKTHLSALLDRVAKGESITITRHGIPAAVLGPVVETEAKLFRQEIVESMQAPGKRVKHSEMSVREMVNETRRF